MFSSECQDKFISSFIESQDMVSIYLKNGVKLTGKIIGRTENAIFLNCPVPQMIYKKQISTIMHKAD